MSELKDLKKIISEKQKAVEKSGKVLMQAQDDHNQNQQELEQAVDEHMKARTAGYDVKLVANAKRLGINPDNFNSEDELADTVGEVLKTRKLAKEETADEPATGEEGAAESGNVS